MNKNVIIAIVVILIVVVLAGLFVHRRSKLMYQNNPQYQQSTQQQANPSISSTQTSTNDVNSELDSIDQQMNQLSNDNITPDPVLGF